MKTRPLILAAVCLSAFGCLSKLHAEAPKWSAPCSQNAMVIYAKVMDASGLPLMDPGSLLSASEYGTVAGVTPVSAGPKGPVYQMKVGSDRWESELTYSLYDATSGKTLEIGPGPGFVAASVVGSIVDPVILTVK